jgi:uncharacterized protein
LILKSILIVYGTLCLAAYAVQGRFIFVPQSEILETPAQFQVSYQEVWLPVPQAPNQTEKIHGWWIPAQKPTQSTLLYLHGNGSNIGANTAHALRFQSLGFNVLLIDYRGYGKSEGGFPSETSVYIDAETAWQYLIRDRKLQPSQIYIYGHSLGGAIAIELATHHPDAAGLIVDGSFTSTPAVAAQKPLYRLLPLELILHQRFDSLSKIKSIRIPTLFIHGDADTIIPIDMGQELFTAKPEPKQFLAIAGAGHNNGAKTNWPAYKNAVLELLKQSQPR